MMQLDPGGQATPDRGIAQSTQEEDGPARKKARPEAYDVDADKDDQRHTQFGAGERARFSSNDRGYGKGRGGGSSRGRMAWYNNMRHGDSWRREIEKEKQAKIENDWMAQQWQSQFGNQSVPVGPTIVPPPPSPTTGGSAVSSTPGESNTAEDNAGSSSNANTVELTEKDFQAFPRTLAGLNDQRRMIKWLVSTPWVQALTVVEDMLSVTHNALHQLCSVWGLECRFPGQLAQRSMVIMKGGSLVQQGSTAPDISKHLHGIFVFLLANSDLVACTFFTDLPTAQQDLVWEQVQRYGLRCMAANIVGSIMVFKPSKPATAPKSQPVEVQVTNDAAVAPQEPESPEVADAAKAALQAPDPLVLYPFEIPDDQNSVGTWLPVASVERVMKCALPWPRSLVLHRAEKVRGVYHCTSVPLDLPLAIEEQLQSHATKEGLAPVKVRKREPWVYSVPPVDVLYPVNPMILTSLAEERSQLPIAPSMEAILDSVHKHRVTILEGPTGSGKTTQVPQYIADCPGLLEEGHPVILITQPRRMAAINAATRVALERGQEVGQEVGYLVRFETAIGPTTRIIYVTSGILLRRLQEDPMLKGVGCVIVDEVHERSLDIDFCLLIMKQLLLAGQLKAKLVVMSATLQANVFINYFADALATVPSINEETGEPDAPNHVHLEGQSYPVEAFFLEEALCWVGYCTDPHTGEACPGGGKPVDSSNLLRSCLLQGEEAEIVREMERQQLNAVLARAPKLSPGINVMSCQVELIVELVMMIHRAGLPGGILVFLPGLRDIDQAKRTLENCSCAGELLILPVHSMLPRQCQQALFQAPPAGMRKVALATNIAESSITVADVVFVIDCGLMKGMQYDPARNISSLNNLPVSKANVLQRRGRAGRVQPGVSIHLFPRATYDELDQSPESELLQVPLEEVLLRIKSLGKEDVHTFLALAIDAPHKQNIDNALQHLQKIGALDADQKMNDLGSLLAAMPLPAKLGKLLVLGAMFGVLFPVAVIAAFMACRSPFIASLDPAMVERLRQRRLRNFQDTEVPCSDHIILLRIFQDWTTTANRGQFCFQYGLSNTSMREISNTAHQYVQCFQDELKFDASPLYHRHASNERLASAVVALCMYPNVVSQCGKSQWYFAYDVLPVVLSRDNAACKEKGDALPDLLTFFEHMATEGKARVGISSEVPPVSVVLMCQSLQVVQRWKPPKPDEPPAEPNQVQAKPPADSDLLVLCDNWLFLVVPSQKTLDTLMAAREALHAHVHHFAASRHSADLNQDLLDAIGTAIGGGEDLGGPMAVDTLDDIFPPGPGFEMFAAGDGGLETQQYDNAPPPYWEAQEYPALAPTDGCAAAEEWEYA